MRLARAFSLLIRALPALVALAAAPAWAQDYPAKPVRLIVPFPQGGVTDLLGRLVAERMKDAGYTMIVDNRPGASGHVGAELAARAPGDGYTLMAGTIGIHAAYMIYDKLNYDPATELKPVMVLGDAPNVLVVPANSPFRTFGDFLAAAKAQPGKLNYGSAGPGSSIFMVTALFEQATGVRMNHVPYKGSGPALVDLIGGQIDLMFENLGSGLPHIRSGKLRALAVTGQKRDARLPDVPTVDESGVTGFAAGSWFTLAAPASMPDTLIEKVNADVRRVLSTPEALAKFDAMGVVKVADTPAEAAQFFAAERAKWSKVIETAGIKLK